MVPADGGMLVRKCGLVSHNSPLCFFVSFTSKELSIQTNGLESTLASISISVDSEWVSLAVHLSSGEARVRQGGLGALGKHGSPQKRWI